MVAPQVELHNTVMNIFVALGANLPSTAGSPRRTLQAALREIDSGFTQLEALSDCYQTPCFPDGAGPDYVNAVAKVNSRLSANSLMARLHEIESRYGRTRDERWGARGIDLDLLAYDDSILPDRATFEHWSGLSPDLQAQAAPDRLVLPHPRIQDRGFVLVPMHDIAPDWQHPVLGRSVARMLSDLGPQGRAGITPIGWTD